MPAAIETKYRLLGKKKIEVAKVDEPYKIAGKEAYFVPIKAGEDACAIPIPIEDGKKILINDGDRIARRTEKRKPAAGDIIILTKEEINDRKNQPLLSPLAISPLGFFIGEERNIIWIETMPPESAKVAKKRAILNAVAHLVHFIKG